MSDPIRPIFDAAFEIRRLADSLPHVPLAARAEQGRCLRAHWEDLTLLHERLNALGLSLIRAQDAAERRALEWDINRALDDLLASSREHIEVAGCAPLPPDAFELSPDRQREYAEKLNVVVQACQAAGTRQLRAWERVGSLAQRIDLE